MQIKQVMNAVVEALETGKSLKAFSDADVVSAYEGAKHLRSAVVAEMAHRHGKKSADEVRMLVLPLIAKLYSVALVRSESNRNKGELTLDRDAPNFATAKTAWRDIVADITGAQKRGAGKGKASTSQKFDVPADVMAAALKLVALVQQYDLDDAGLKALAATAVADAFAK